MEPEPLAHPRGWRQDAGGSVGGHYHAYPDPLHEVHVTLPLMHEPHATQLAVSVAVTGCRHCPPCPPHDQHVVRPLPPHEPQG